MTDIMLRPARWKVLAALVVAILASAPLVLSASGGLARLDLGFCAIVAVTGAAYAYFASGRYLRLRPEALEVKERFSAGRYTLWSDVDEIGVARFPSSARGRLSYQYLAGIRLRDGAAQAMTDVCRKNRDACGYDILLEPNYGLGLDQFVALLKDKKRESQKG